MEELVKTGLTRMRYSSMNMHQLLPRYILHTFSSIFHLFDQAKTLGQLTGTIESRYLDTYNGIVALEKDRSTVNRLTLRSGGGPGLTPRSQDVKKGSRSSREKREETKKPPVKTMSSGSLLKEYKVEKQRPVTPTVPDESEVDIDELQAALLLQKTLKGRSVQLRLMKGRDRKQDLIYAMKLENPITEGDAEKV